MQNKKIILSEKTKSVIAAVAAIAVLILAIGAPLAVMTSNVSHKPVIVLDAGHGGADGGVTGRTTGVKESDLNLAVTKLLGEYLSSAGFSVVYTRTNKNGAYPDFFGLGYSKKEDMEKRAKTIKKANPIAVVSIHMNFFSAHERRGAQVFFGSSEQSRRCADIIQERLNYDLNAADAGREFAPLYAEKYILECADSVVIVECGFLSNIRDESNLINPEYQAKLAYSIFRGIAIYTSASHHTSY